MLKTDGFDTDHSMKDVKYEDIKSDSDSQDDKAKKDSTYSSHSNYNPRKELESKWGDKS